MKKLSSTLPNMLLSLTGICLMAAAVLSFVNDSTKETIAASKIKALETAIGEVTPEFDNKPLDEKLVIKVAEDDLIVYPAKKAGTLVGAAIESVSHNGFGGDVKVLVGIDTEGKVVNYSVLQMVETPGLGDKMFHWFKTDKGKQSIIGYDINGGHLKVTKDGGSIDAITAATISSRAFLDAVNKAQDAYKESLNQLQ
ncbi:RnfABCDGE type electron transport complex subunit G [Porphyromonas sp.]|uniref:RnfABCDGE type electron transport complex subunit G n=1 Tax=Porphyromonas sp. TaxID=1924944 RepID=UPI0026DC869D|nr:RnfABCDGE type electron transport complex subunit G [Porphyromonas sp.]MDO4695382.1 RnfABCDGE type electron transport complex subunit G [Porphyromonas sp.]MDO4770491.1 RnfABCDGE type electron transport complex subunit G [Porphyromonas sp.]